MRIATSLLLLLTLSACESSNPGGADVVTPGDVTSDATPDVALDVAADATPDVTTDVTPDVAADVVRDVAADVASDTPVDLPGRDGGEPFCDIPAMYTYGYDGGLVASRESMQLAPGRQFTYTRMDFRTSDAGTRTCTTMLDYCGTSDGGTVDTLGVIVAFNDADVMAAFADQMTTLYGCDSRPVDGQVFVVTRGDGRHFEIGNERGSSGCRAIPAGLTRLRTALTNLQMQQLARPECAGARP